MQAFDVVQQLTVASSRARKEQIITEAYANKCFEFFEAVQLAADPFIHFGITKVAEIIEDDGAPGSLTFADFRRLCDRLRSGSMVNDVARIAIREAAERCHAITWNRLYRRILLKDLKVDPNIVNRVLKRLDAGYLRVPQVHCQTATPSQSVPETGQYLVDTKLTGDRLIAVLDKSVRLLSSAGEMRLNLEIAHALQTLAGRLPAAMVLDGILIETGEYLVFDIISLSDFRVQASAKTQHERRVILELLQTSGAFDDTRYVRVLPQIAIDFGTDAGKHSFQEFVQQATQHGHQTLMLKKPNAPYHGKQNRAWLQWEITNT